MCAQHGLSKLITNSFQTCEAPAISVNMEYPIRRLENDDVVVEVHSEVNTVRTFVDEVLPDARVSKLFSGTVERFKLEVSGAHF